jgi:hypothetical protein
MDIVAMIEKHNLSVRRIPNKVSEVLDIRHFKEGDDLLVSSNGRKFCRRYRVPENAGKYMVKSVGNTFLSFDWNNDDKKTLADTLEKSIELFLSKDRLDWVDTLQKSS